MVLASGPPAAAVLAIAFAAMVLVTAALVLAGRLLNRRPLWPAESEEVSRIDPATRRRIWRDLRHGRRVADPGDAAAAVALARTQARSMRLSAGAALALLPLGLASLTLAARRGDTFGIVMWSVHGAIALAGALFLVHGRRRAQRAERLNRQLLDSTLPGSGEVWARPERAGIM